MSVKDWIPLEPWNYQVNVVLVLGVGIAAFFLCMLFYKNESAEYKARVGEFYERMHKPVNYKGEVGASRDAEQLKVIGGFVSIVGLLVLLLLLVPNDAAARWGIVFVSAFISGVGLLMFWRSRCSRPL
jgi:hypothetical protein